MSFDRPRQDRLRTVFRRFGAVQRGKHRDHVVPVDNLDCPFLRLELLPVNLHVVPIHGRLALSEGVHIRQYGQIFQLVVTGKGSRFPNLPLSHFSIAQHDVYTGRALVYFCADRQAGSHGQSLAEGPRRGVHTRNARSGMALQLARKLAQCHHSRFRKNPSLSECSVEHRRGMPLRKHETITVWRIWIFGVELHCVEKRAGYKLRRGQARGRVPRACCRRRHHGKNAKSLRFFPNRIDSRCRCANCISRTQKTLLQKFDAAGPAITCQRGRLSYDRDLATYFDHLVVRQSENICNTN
jgi:hypothetical protein